MKIANIGSSFSAGPGIYPQVDSKAGRSASNFAHLFAKHVDAELIDVSVAGATLLNMLTEPQVAHGHTFPPQIEGLPTDADIVLVLGGGNDMLYLSNIIAETWVGWVLMQAMKFFGGSTSGPADEDEVYRRYGALLDAIHARAPKARVVVVEYLTIFGADVTQNNGRFCTNERWEYHRSIAKQLQRATSKAVDERQPWCELLHTAELSDGHGLGSQDPWVFGLDFSALLRKEAWAHPNLKGMEAVANALKEWFANRSS